MRRGHPLLYATLATAAFMGLHKALDPYSASLLLLVGINALLALSLNLVNGITGQFSLGHAGFMALGAYAAAWASAGPLRPLFASPALSHLGVALDVALAAVVAGLAGWVVGLPSLRLKGDYLAIVTLGFAEIVRILIQQTGEVK